MKPPIGALVDFSFPVYKVTQWSAILMGFSVAWGPGLFRKAWPTNGEADC